MKTEILVASTILFGIVGVIVGINSGKKSERRYTNLCLRIGKKLATIQWFYLLGYASNHEWARANEIIFSETSPSPKEINGYLNDILKDISDHVSADDLANQIKEFQRFMSK